jgi:hypothetical protein
VTREDLAMITFMATVPALLMMLFVLAVLAVSRMTAASGQRSYVIAVGAFGGLMVVGLASIFWSWGIGFDYADTYRRPPAYVDRVKVSSFWVATGAYLGVLTTGLLAHRARRRLTASA